LATPTSGKIFLRKSLHVIRKTHTFIQSRSIPSSDQLITNPFPHFFYNYIICRRHVYVSEGGEALHNQYPDKYRGSHICTAEILIGKIDKAASIEKMKEIFKDKFLNARVYINWFSEDTLIKLPLHCIGSNLKPSQRK
jgi:hypothetical protein